MGRGEQEKEEPVPKEKGWLSQVAKRLSMGVGDIWAIGL